ncbi:MAG: hypothetical protein A2086_11980 [Spirochaetes bacterium GWD1_27_9]|nr:MAG: hypothetical protein A2Z98_06860 [Spirochaetes bacterium GWB1_27_13]OHD22109.1 MAG: hypothetical protein A2Y34_13450 [Spirochaetes bacterium GWC1_27_15]OHD28954.1 MAG: hypothetical protein A2086_11980 [Spirochaetes bacterium GWD1_27_9]
MSNFAKRLILTLVCVPLVIFSFFWPSDSHIIIILLFGILVPILGSYEINSLIIHKGIKIRKFYLPVINFSIYVFAYFYANNIFNIQKFKPLWIVFSLCVVVVFSSIYARDIFAKNLTKSFEKMSNTLFGILYIGIPSFLLPFIFNVSLNPQNPAPIFYNIESKGTLTGSFLAVYFIVVVWSNDIFAYIFGMNFGRKNIIGLTASPNKSWAGYIGAYFSTFVFVFIFYFLFNKFLGLPVWLYFVFPAVSGFLTPIGDLAESVFKRSANVKDSGDIIMGRGGILDSVDTILYVYPIYFLLVQLYFAFSKL